MLKKIVQLGSKVFKSKLKLCVASYSIIYHSVQNQTLTKTYYCQNKTWVCTPKHRWHYVSTH